MSSYGDPVSGIRDVEPAKETSRISSADASNTLGDDHVVTSRRRIPSFIRKLGAGIILDIRARTPWYLSDWTDAWNYRVVPATALIFFAKYVSEHYDVMIFVLIDAYSVLPGIAFSLDLIETTQQYGVTEVLISSFMAAFVFSVFGAQPLTIAGVTGERQFCDVPSGMDYS